MIKSLLVSGLLAGAMAFSFVGTANAEIVKCSKHNLAMIHDGLGKMDESTAKGKEAMKMSMDELEMAMTAKGKGDIAGCRMHAAMAMDHMHGK
jgi:hypothetical protein